jgi:crotonobetainyl-CoA:carnitine CoA-transferase CaiB-like acyl-CoA transferase
MAAGGPPWSCGYDDHSLPPVRGWGNQGYHTGCHFAVMSILTALLYRGSSGEGQFIDVSMTAALNVTTEAASYSWLVNQSTVQRQTGRHAAVQPTGETQMQCADGRYVNTGVPPRFAAEFAKLLTWLRELGLADDFPEAVFLEIGANWDGPFDLSLIGHDDTVTAVFSAGRDALGLIASMVSAHDFFVGCQTAGLAVGVVNSPEEVFEDEHFIARGLHVPVLHDDFDMTIVYPGVPFNLPACPSAISRRAPHLGEHNAEIFADIA